MYLLDSDTVIFLLRGDPKVTKNLEAHAGDPKAISVITYGELLFGAKRSARPLANMARVRSVAELLPVIGVSPPVMETFASLKAELEQRGRKVDDFDLIIASTAIQLDYALVTNNTRHFRDIPGLRIDNWAR